MTMTKIQLKNSIIDTRVSSDKQLQKRGLEEQIAICRNFAQRNNWVVKKVFSKSFSGRAEERSDFEEILRYIKASNARGEKIDFYIVKSIDRLTRNGHLTYSDMKTRIESVGAILVDTYGVIQEKANTLEHLNVAYDWSHYTPSETSELLEAKRGKDEVRDILTRMIGAEISLTRDGYSMRAPNEGYLNTKEIIGGKEQSVLMQDPDRANFFKLIFKLRASGSLTDQEIVDRVNALGYLSKPHKVWEGTKSAKRVVGYSKPKPLEVKRMQSIVKKTLYAGIRDEKWTVQPTPVIFAEGESPIVSIEEFNKANRGGVYIKKSHDGSIEILKNYHARSLVKRLKYRKDYKYDKMIACNTCRKPLKNSGKGNTGKSGKGFQAHHCDRVLDGTKHYMRVPKKEFEQKVSYYLENLRFDENFIDKLREKVVNKYREREKEILDQSISVGGNVTNLKTKQSNLMEKLDHVSSPIVIKKIEDQIEELEEMIDKATEQRDKMEIKERDIKSFMRYVRNLMEHPMKILGNNTDPYQQKAFFNLVFKEMPTYEEILNGTPKLSLVFKLSEEFKTDKSALVILRGIEPRFPG